MKPTSDVADNGLSKKEEILTMPDNTLESTSDCTNDTKESSGPVVTLIGGDGTRGEDNATSNVMAQYIDITEPLSTLRTLLEQKLGLQLDGYSFYLQDLHELDASRNLVDRCVEACEGLVQVNIEITSKEGKNKINIIDILKPEKEILKPSPLPQEQSDNSSQIVSKAISPMSQDQKIVARWVQCTRFRKKQEKLKMPNDPLLWTNSHVKIWFNWATMQFGLTGINQDDWNINGKQLCELARNEFVKRVPFDNGHLFWTHLELLKKCKFVAVVQQPISNAQNANVCKREDSDTVNIMAQYIDITEPLSTLRTLLEKKLGFQLDGYSFYLQDLHELDASRNLVDQCVEGEGLVQVNIEIISKEGKNKINIIDILKPAKEILETSSLPHG